MKVKKDGRILSIVVTRLRICFFYGLKITFWKYERDRNEDIGFVVVSFFV